MGRAKGSRRQGKKSKNSDHRGYSAAPKGPRAEKGRARGRRDEEPQREPERGGFGRAPRPAPRTPDAETFSYGPSIPYSAGRGEGGRPERQDREDRFPKGKGRPPRRNEAQEVFPRGKAKGGAKSAKTLIGHFQKNPRGFGFLTFEGREFEDLFIPPKKAEEFFHGDKIAVEIAPNGQVHSFEVVDHRIKELYGRYTPEIGHDHEKGAWVTFERKAAGERIYCPGGAKGAKKGEWVKVRLTYLESGPYKVTGEILEAIGEEMPASMDVAWVASELGLVEKHPDDVVAEAKALPPPNEKDFQSRKDLRKLPLITIDGITARDFDDAVYVERIKHGYVLWVAIADVSHYVKEGTRLDEEAYARATSVYFPERAFHMLPSALSENLCSLRPDEDRLCMVAKMSFDTEGSRMETEIFNAVMRSGRRATYEEIQKEFEVEGHNHDWLFAPHFELYKLIRKKKMARGYIDFDLPETKILVDKDGEPIDIVKTDRFDSHRLIEEFMISANEAVTEWAMEHKHPFIYRIHEEPSAESLGKFQEMAATVGIHFDIEKAQRDPRVLAEVVRQMDSHPAKTMLNTMLLRAMKQAVYSAEHNIHYGLGSKAYTHFTSPIRRYPDLVVHRMLKLLIQKGKRVDYDALEEKLGMTADHCSQRERLATQAERESTKLKQARFMSKRLGEEYHGVVNGMTDKGLYIQLGGAHDAPFVEGFIPKDTMTDDFYAFNEDRMIFYGKRKKRTFKVGDDVLIRVSRVNLERREIEFELLDHTPKLHSKPPRHPVKNTELTRRKRR